MRSRPAGLPLGSQATDRGRTPAYMQIRRQADQARGDRKPEHEGSVEWRFPLKAIQEAIAPIVATENPRSSDSRSTETVPSEQKLKPKA